MVVHITYFVHGTTTDNEQNKCTGWNDGELSQLGKDQSVKLKEQIKGKGFDIVFCSDLKRAVDSAELTFGKKLLIVKDARLRECNYGKFNGASEDAFVKEEHVTEPHPDGES